MKESKPRGPKNTEIRVISRREMAPDRQASFEKAVDVLLSELIRHLDRRQEGEPDGGITD